MSMGAKPSASREFDGLDLDHNPPKISFPGYKVSYSYTEVCSQKF